jgi:hypothetical protein
VLNRLLLGGRFLPLAAGDDGTGELGEGVALAGEGEGLVPPEGGPLHLEAQPRQALAECFEGPDRSGRRGEVAREVGVGIDHDPCHVELGRGLRDIRDRPCHHVPHVILVGRFNGTEGDEGLVHGVLEDLPVLGHGGGFLCLVIDVIGMDEEKAHLLAPFSLECYQCSRCRLIYHPFGFHGTE